METAELKKKEAEEHGRRGELNRLRWQNVKRKEDKVKAEAEAAELKKKAE